MTPDDKPWNTRLKHNAQHSSSRVRNRPVVMALTVTTVVLALAGLFGDLQLASRGLTIACYAAAVVSGGVLLAFLFLKRLWVMRRSER